MTDKAGVEAIGRVMAERDRQDEKWGANRCLSNGTWLKIVVEELGEACEADLENQGADRVLEEVTQAAAVTVAWMEQLIRENG